MTEITSSLEQRCQELVQEIATLQDYNRRWLEIQVNADTEKRRVEVFNAIKTNNDLLGAKSFQVNEILQGRNPFDTQEVVATPSTERLADLTVLARICKVRFFSFPFEWAFYKPSSVSVTETEVLLQPSTGKFSSVENDLLIIPKGQITSVDCDGIKINIKTESLDQYVVWATDQHAAEHLRQRLLPFLSVRAEQIANENFAYFDEALKGNTTAWVTPLLITINVAVFMLMVTEGYGVFSPDTKMASDWGANDGSLTLNGEWWRIISSLFLHYGVLHLLLNMNVLWIFGSQFERIFGSTKFLFLYFYSGVIGAIVSLWYSPWKVGIGASGAIFGLIGGLTAIAFIPKLRPPVSIAKGWITSGFFFVVINGAIGLSIPVIDNAAHFGGLIGGAICGIILASSSGSKHKNKLDFALAMRLMVATTVVVSTAYFLLLNNTIIQKDLQTKKSVALYDKSVKLIASDDYIDAMELARKASDLGDPLAPNLVGVLHNRGWGVKKDPVEAALWFKLGVERDDPYAMVNLSNYYRSAKPPGVKFSEMNTLLLSAAKKEHFPAHVQLELSVLFSNCDGQEGEHLKKAIFDGAEEGVPAMIALKGWLFYDGRCVSKDQLLGIKLLHKSYDLGAGRAGDMLGRIYRNATEDRPADLVQALKYFETGAEKGDPRAQYELAVAYRDGLGVPIDQIRAVHWFKKAAAQKNSKAKDALKQLE